MDEFGDDFDFGDDFGEPAPPKNNKSKPKADNFGLDDDDFAFEDDAPPKKTTAQPAKPVQKASLLDDLDGLDDFNFEEPEVEKPKEEKQQNFLDDFNDFGLDSQGHKSDAKNSKSRSESASKEKPEVKKPEVKKLDDMEGLGDFQFEDEKAKDSFGDFGNDFSDGLNGKPKAVQPHPAQGIVAELQEFKAQMPKVNESDAKFGKTFDDFGDDFGDDFAVEIDHKESTSSETKRKRKVKEVERFDAGDDPEVNINDSIFRGSSGVQAEPAQEQIEPQYSQKTYQQPQYQPRQADLQVQNDFIREQKQSISQLQSQQAETSNKLDKISDLLTNLLMNLPDSQGTKPSIDKQEIADVIRKEITQVKKQLENDQETMGHQIYSKLDETTIQLKAKLDQPINVLQQEIGILKTNQQTNQQQFDQFFNNMTQKVTDVKNMEIEVNQQKQQIEFAKKQLVVDQENTFQQQKLFDNFQQLVSESSQKLSMNYQENKQIHQALLDIQNQLNFGQVNQSSTEGQVSSVQIQALNKNQNEIKQSLMEQLQMLSDIQIKQSSPVKQQHDFSQIITGITQTFEESVKQMESQMKNFMQYQLSQQLFEKINQQFNTYVTNLNSQFETQKQNIENSLNVIVRQMNKMGSQDNQQIDSVSPMLLESLQTLQHQTQQGLSAIFSQLNSKIDQSNQQIKSMIEFLPQSMPQTNTTAAQNSIIYVEALKNAQSRAERAEQTLSELQQGIHEQNFQVKQQLEDNERIKQKYIQLEKNAALKESKIKEQEEQSSKLADQLYAKEKQLLVREQENKMQQLYFQEQQKELEFKRLQLEKVRFEINEKRNEFKMQYMLLEAENEKNELLSAQQSETNVLNAIRSASQGNYQPRINTIPNPQPNMGSYYNAKQELQNVLQHPEFNVMEPDELDQQVSQLKSSYINEQRQTKQIKQCNQQFEEQRRQMMLLLQNQQQLAQQKQMVQSQQINQSQQPQQQIPQYQVIQTKPNYPPPMYTQEANAQPSVSNVEPQAKQVSVKSIPQQASHSQSNQQYQQPQQQKQQQQQYQQQPPQSSQPKRQTAPAAIEFNQLPDLSMTTPSYQQANPQVIRDDLSSKKPIFGDASQSYSDSNALLKQPLNNPFANAVPATRNPFEAQVGKSAKIQNPFVSGETTKKDSSGIF